MIEGKTMLRRIFIAFALMLGLCTSTADAQESAKPRVAVVDFATINGAMSGELNADKVGMMCVDYIVEALVDSGQFFVMSNELAAKKLADEKLDCAGVIPPSMIRRLGEILEVDFIILGGVYGVGNDQSILEVVSNGAKINAVKACIIARMVDVRTGNIVAMAEGRGESKSSLVKVGKDNLGFITVGTKKVPQVSVHNSIKKAAAPLVAEFISGISNWRRGS